MKKIILILTVTTLFVACKNKTAGYEKPSYLATSIGHAALQKANSERVQAMTGSERQVYYNRTSTNTAKKKKGMSKAAKGAIIGGATGAITGGVITRSGKGAVIGGVLGAGTGYIIGRKKDKKDGRVQ